MKPKVPRPRPMAAYAAIVSWPAGTRAADGATQRLQQGVGRVQRARGAMLRLRVPAQLRRRKAEISW